MGIAANQARLMTLTARQSDLELRAQSISAVKMRIAMQQQSVATNYSAALNDWSKVASLDGQKTYKLENGAYVESTDLDAISGDDLRSDFSITTAEHDYDSAVQSLAAQEKMLDLELTQINTEHTAIKTEYDSIKSLIKDNVDKSFNVFG